MSSTDAPTKPQMPAPDAVSAGKRSLRNLSLAYLMESGSRKGCNLVSAQFAAAMGGTRNARMQA